MLVFPNHYAVGLPNLGFQSVYRLLNSMESVVCERAFLPEYPGPAVSVESNRNLEDFDIIAFSISFENDYLNLLYLLQNLPEFRCCLLKDTKRIHLSLPEALPVSSIRNPLPILSIAF